MTIRWGSEAWKDYRACQPKVRGKINRMINEICSGAVEGIGKPKALRGELEGWLARRVTDKHRLVYRVRGDVLDILQCLGHYDDH
jgi:toxin YoeB